jgi:hypothetical protein
VPYERTVWILALLRYFTKTEQAGLGQILAALDLPEPDFHAARRRVEDDVAAGVARGDLTSATRLAEELGRAEKQIATTSPTLATLEALARAEGRGTKVTAAPTLASTAATSADETAVLPIFLPKAVMPFQPGRAAGPTAAPPPPPVAAERRTRGEAPGADDETQELKIVTVAEPLPFQKK